MVLVECRARNYHPPPAAAIKNPPLFFKMGGSVLVNIIHEQVISANVKQLLHLLLS
jgi:hypothetical protein